MKTAIKVSLNERTAAALIDMQERWFQKTGERHALSHIANVAIISHYNMILLKEGQNAQHEPDKSE